MAILTGRRWDVVVSVCISLVAMDNPDQKPELAWEVNFLIYFFLELYYLIFNSIYYLLNGHSVRLPPNICVYGHRPRPLSALVRVVLLASAGIHDWSKC